MFAPARGPVALIECFAADAASAGSMAMQQFVPFEDDWDALESLWAQALVPYQAGMPIVAAIATHPMPPLPAPPPLVPGMDEASVPGMQAIEGSCGPSHRRTSAL